jgi:hypothetical protein
MDCVFTAYKLIDNLMVRIKTKTESTERIHIAAVIKPSALEVLSLACRPGH